MAYGSGAGALVEGKDGYFYGVTQFGGDYGAGSIFQFVPNGPDNGTFNSYPLAPQQDQYGYQIALGINTLVLASNGVATAPPNTAAITLEMVRAEKATASCFALIRMALRTCISFDENSFHGFGPIGAMVQGTNGAFYGITSSGGANGYGTIFKFTPGAARRLRCLV